MAKQCYQLKSGRIYFKIDLKYEKRLAMLILQCIANIAMLTLFVIQVQQKNPSAAA